MACWSWRPKAGARAGLFPRASNLASARPAEFFERFSATANQPGLWQALIFGFLGGFILNLMPCVLPVISLKIFGFIRQAGDHPERILRHGLAFVAGIFAWFLGLGLVILGLKSTGSEVTWAFQFQNPWFNLIIGCIVFVFALNLFGVFEIVLPGRASTALAEASSQEGYSGSFFQGIFATLLATPCTAPFLGTALGFAFSQSSVVILAMFASVALGMSAPYFLLSAQTGMDEASAETGRMDGACQAIHGISAPGNADLASLHPRQSTRSRGRNLVRCFPALPCVACWIYGAFCGPLSSVRTRVVSLAAIVLIVFGGAQILSQRRALRVRRPPGATSRPAMALPGNLFSKGARRSAGCRRTGLRRFYGRLVYFLQVQRTDSDRCSRSARGVLQKAASFP